MRQQPVESEPVHEPRAAGARRLDLLARRLHHPAEGNVRRADVLAGAAHEAAVHERPRTSSSTSAPGRHRAHRGDPSTRRGGLLAGQPVGRAMRQAQAARHACRQILGASARRDPARHPGRDRAVASRKRVPSGRSVPIGACVGRPWPRCYGRFVSWPVSQVRTRRTVLKAARLPCDMDLTSRLRASQRASSFTESVIREMTRLARPARRDQPWPGLPRLPGARRGEGGRRRARSPRTTTSTRSPGACRRSARRSPRPTLRDYGMTVDPETEICVTCGATEAMSAAFLGVLDPGDEVVVFEPFYESYGPDAILAGASLRYVTLRPPDWAFDPDELAAAFGAADAGDRRSARRTTRPGRCSRARSSSEIAELCVEHDAIAITDEIYEHITYDGGEHVPIATLPGMARADRHDQRAVEDVRGHRLARRVGDRAAGVDGRHPLDARLPHGGGRDTVAAGRGGRDRRCPPAYYERIRRDYAERRDVMMRVLREAGFVADRPAGRVLRDGRRVVARASTTTWPPRDTWSRRSGSPRCPGRRSSRGRSSARTCCGSRSRSKLETLEEAGQRLSEGRRTQLRPGARMSAGSKRGLDARRRGSRPSRRRSSAETAGAARRRGAMPPERCDALADRVRARLARRTAPTRSRRRASARYLGSPPAAAVSREGTTAASATIGASGNAGSSHAAGSSSASTATVLAARVCSATSSGQPSSRTSTRSCSAMHGRRERHGLEEPGRRGRSRPRA